MAGSDDGRNTGSENDSINPLPTSHAPMRHGLSIRQWEFTWGMFLILGVYTLVHGFCFFQLFLMVGKGFIPIGTS